MKVTRHHISLPLQYPLSVFAEAEAEVVLATDFDTCARAAVEMAKKILFLRSTGHKWDGYTLDEKCAQAVIDQYGERP